MKKIIVGAMFVLLGATTAQAVEIPLETKVENRLMSAFGPMLKVRSVEPLANQQLLEVILIDGATVHMTPDTNYFIFIDSLYQLTPTGAENITENRLNPKRAAALKKVADKDTRSEEHTSELQSRPHLVCRLLLEKKNHYQNLSVR